MDNKNTFLNNYILYNGGYMRRLFRMSFLAVMFCVLGINVQAQNKPEVLVGGRVAPGDVRVFVKDSVYKIQQSLVIGGTLIIEPGTTLKFSSNGRIIDSTGGRLIADGYAKATYTAQPNGINPMPNRNAYGWTGYADLNYFLHDDGASATISKGTAQEPTISASKNDYVFNVILNTQTRQLRDGYNQLNGNGFTLGANEVAIPFEKAIIYSLSGIENVTDAVNDIRNNYAWRRPNSSENVELTEGTINFVGQVTNNFTREKGHIIVLPGARAAFFRNCTFENMRKDTTVDRMDYYAAGSMPNAAKVNASMLKLTNGAGGAITTFSSRTWLVNCEFNHNFARNAAGALQVLQTPEGFPTSDAKYNALGYYPSDKNPALTDPNGDPSSFNRNIKMIDNIDDYDYAEMTDYERQAYDDARVAMLLGRMRNLKFNYNTASLTNVAIKNFGGFPVEMDDEDAVADYPQVNGNYANGGALVIRGREEDKAENQIEVGLGINTKIKMRNANGSYETVTITPFDSVEFNGNYTLNLQNAIGSEGANGGAIYLGENTSLITAGKYNANSAKTPNLGEETMEARAGLYACGGAIYEAKTTGRLQVRGISGSMNAGIPTRFTRNTAARGGAIYVDQNYNTANTVVSPIIGGADDYTFTRDYGYNIKFEENTATTEGGAIYTERNMRINGAGGVVNNALVGYTDDFRIHFDNNEAALSGGAITIAVPFINPALPTAQRSIHFARALFTNNKVGYTASAYNKDKVRGGGAVYSENADMNVVKGVEFRANYVKNGNGAAIHMVHPVSFNKRFFVSDLDQIVYDADGVAKDVVSYDDPFILNRETAKYPADARMLTRFLDNVIEWDDDVLASQSGNGMTQITSGTVTTSADINAIEFIDNQNGFAVGAQGTIIKLTNAGTIWEYKNLSTPYNLTAIHFTTDRIGYIAGDRGLIMKTTDGGNTWNIVNEPSTTFNINALTFVNSELGYAVGQNGNMLKTVNAGQNWTAVETGTANHLMDVRFAGVNNGYAIGKRGTILNTTNGGETWSVLNANTFVDLNSIYFTDATTGFIAANGAIFKTVNGGQTWTTVYNEQSKNFNTIFFTSLTDGFAYGSYGAVAKTTDAGATWTAADVKLDGVKKYFSFSDVFYPTQNVAVLAAANGMMLRTEDNGETWNSVLPYDQATVDVKRYHPALTGLRENGIGLGGAIYVLDSISTREGKDDFIRFNRVRMQNNVAYTGAAIYSDNYDLKMIMTRSLVTGNVAKSDIGNAQNAITGPALDNNGDGKIDANYASSDLAGAVLYGEIVGPEPYVSASWGANSIYNNDARFLIRLPDAANTKGALAGRRPGEGGVDTLQGNYWGKTEADVTLYLNNVKDNNYPGRNFENEETFFVEKCDRTYLSYVYGSADTLEQGPFEYNGTYTTTLSNDETITRFNYLPVALRNGENENVADANTIPEKFLFSGRVYDLYDKGTDIKVTDYSNRRMSPIEDFAVGIAPVVKSHVDANHPNGQTYLTRWIRDPFVVEQKDEAGNLVYPMIANMQGEWKADVNNLTDATKGFYHPIGYPLFLESKVDYDGDIEVSNHDTRLLNESVYFVINETTGDFIRTNMKQVAEEGDNWETYRSRVELIPDMTKRNQQTTLRRTAEKLLNLGVGDVLLYALKSNPESEDNAAMRGRKYYGPHTQMGGRLVNGVNSGINNLYLNRDIWAPSNQETATYFGGEKYQALPVDTGDVVRVISRTVLWADGVVKAYNEGIAFKITNSTMPPVFTGDVVKLATDTIVKQIPDDQDPNIVNTVKITDFLNKRFVTEDRTYPQESGVYSERETGDAGVDSILAITAVDYSNFYDPRAQDDATANYYANLKYSLSMNDGSAVSKWLRYTLRPAGVTGNKNVKDEAEGYMVLRGTPMNPYVVPGGEKVRVTVQNFPPSKRVIDDLRDVFGQDTLDKFMYIFPSYFNAPEYDLGENARRARFLQQDTIYNTSNDYADYEFDMFVVDSMPVFVDNGATPEVYYKDVNYTPVNGVAPMYQDSNAVRVMYLPSIYRNGFCSVTEDGKLIASLTDKLRFQADFNTTDEAEDEWAAKDNWDFKYGKTSYGFYNVAMRDNPADTAIMSLQNQTRPTWMANNYVYAYNSDTEQDQFLSNFTSQGRLNVRVDGTEARTMLGVNNNYNEGMNLDTVITVVANDGHSGMTMMPVDIYVNVAPKILGDDDARLPSAKEGVDYNPTLNDTTKMIKVYDANRDQNHRFELIYKNDPRTRIPKDPCFSEAGYWDLGDLKTTPSWLKINPQSGLLYGTPTVNDEINPSVDEQVTVIVWDRIKQQANRANVVAMKNNGENLVAVGNNGTIIKVQQDGGSWEFVNVAGAEAFNLNDITFVPNDPQVGYIVGNNGIILKTTNGGAAWNIINTTYRNYNFNAVDFVDAQNGIIAGQNGNVFMTADGGNTWTSLKEANADYTLTREWNVAKMYDANTFFVAGAAGNAIRSTDRGATIENMQNGSRAIVDLCQIGNNKTMMVSENEAFTSTDNGATWTAATTPNPGVNTFRAAGYFDENEVYIAGKNASIYYSHDGGNNFVAANANGANYRVTFDKTSEDLTQNLNDIVMTSADQGFVVADNGIIARIDRNTVYAEKTDNMGNLVQDTTVAINPIIITTKTYDMLSDVKTFAMLVDTASYSPILTSAVRTGCVEMGTTNFADTLYVMDNDLFRPLSGEVITLAVTYPQDANWQLSSTTITRADLEKLTTNGVIPFILTYNGALNATTEENGKIIVRIKATDNAGNETTIEVAFRYSLQPDFLSTITVANNNGSVQVLEWGTAEKTTDKPVSTGDGNDGFNIGYLDDNYCEYEIPPTPDKKVFDARWTIPTRTGTLRNIQPRATPGQACELVYKSTFQTGGNVDATGTSNFVPLKISWDKSIIPGKDNSTINPAGSSWYLRDANSNGNIFGINMATGEGSIMGDHSLTVDGNIVTVQLNSVVTVGFNIVFDCTSGVEDGSLNAGIQTVSPNPVSNYSTVSFGVAEYGNVTIEVYDAIGNLVNTLVNAPYGAGTYNVEFNGTDNAGNNLANGTYTVRMVAGTSVTSYQVKVVR